EALGQLILPNGLLELTASSEDRAETRVRRRDVLIDPDRLANQRLALCQLSGLRQIQPRAPEPRHEPIPLLLALASLAMDGVPGPPSGFIDAQDPLAEVVVAHHPDHPRVLSVELIRWPAATAHHGLDTDRRMKGPEEMGDLVRQNGLRPQLVAG